MIAHCFFEQSGTFKNEFKRLGIKAIDYDIKNDFGQTDNVIDLFNEIEKAYTNENSIFDNIKQDDLIIAFFPCVRFECQMEMNFRGTGSYLKNYSLKDKLIKDMKYHKELSALYNLITELVIICLDRNLKLIIENPKKNYLEKYWAFRPSIIDNNRALRGDWFVKPTLYWFLNFEPKNNFVLEPINYKNIKVIEKCKKIERSLISPDYAKRFILEYIYEEKGGNLSVNYNFGNAQKG